MSANANVGQAVAQDLPTAARTVSIDVNGVDRRVFGSRT